MGNFKEPPPYQEFNSTGSLVVVKECGLALPRGPS